MAFELSDDDKKRFAEHEEMMDKNPLYQAIDDVLNIFGEGEVCSCENKCEGCRYEVWEAKRVLVIALAGVDGQLCEACNGHGWEAEPYKITTNPNGSPCRHFNLCPVCQGKGIKEGYLPPSWKSTREWVQKRHERAADESGGT